MFVFVVMWHGFESFRTDLAKKALIIRLRFTSASYTMDGWRVLFAIFAYAPFLSLLANQNITFMRSQQIAEWIGSDFLLK